MKTPYQVLDVAKDADDTQIKQAYLAMVRRYPPERFPAEFQQVYSAYELIRSEEARLSYRLFHCELPEPADIAELLLSARKEREVNTAEEFRKRLTSGLQQFCDGFRL